MEIFRVKFLSLRFVSFRFSDRLQCVANVFTVSILNLGAYD